MTNKYRRACPYREIDVYRVLEIFGVTNPAIQHAVKKLLCTGIRGSKDFDVDLAETVQALTRLQEMRAEDAKVRVESAVKVAVDEVVAKEVAKKRADDAKKLGSRELYEAMCAPKLPTITMPAIEEIVVSVPGAKEPQDRPAAKYDAEKIDEQHDAEKKPKRIEADVPTGCEVHRIGSGWRWSHAESKCRQTGFANRADALSALHGFLKKRAEAEVARAGELKAAAISQVDEALAIAANEVAKVAANAEVARLEGVDREAKYGNRDMPSPTGKGKGHRYIHPGWGWGQIDDAGLVNHLACNGTGRVRDGDHRVHCKGCRGDGICRAQARPIT